MSLLKEHFRFGVFPGIPIYAVLFFLSFRFGLFSTVGLSAIALFAGGTAVLVGSVLPDMDSRSSPVHHTMFAFFTGLLTFFLNGIISQYSLVVGPILSVWLDRNYLPSHRGFIHTIGAGILFGLVLFAAGYLLLFQNLGLWSWIGSSLVLGHSLHLVKDRCI